MNNITPETFLKTVIPPAELRGERILYTINRGSKWSNRYWPGGRRAIPVGTAPTYYCVSSVALNHDYPRRGYKDVREAWVVVCDDIGTKATAPCVGPSYIIETSSGNHQYGYLIEPWNVSTAEGRQEYDAVLYSLVLAGHNDPGMRNASRVGRLPGSLHQKTGFVSTLKYWAPWRVWGLEDLLPAMGVEKHYPEGGSVVDAAPGKYERLSEVMDSAYTWLVDSWRVLGHSKEWVFIECPWRALHTEGAQGATSTAYSPEDYGPYGPPAFKCLHGHCAGRGLADFRAWLEERGCAVRWGDEDLTDDVRAILASIMTTTEKN